MQEQEFNPTQTATEPEQNEDNEEFNSPDQLEDILQKYN